MSSVSERYVRCPNCRYPNLAGTGVCTQCDADLEENLTDELQSVASETWYEIRRLAICAGVGLAAGGLIAVVAAALTRGVWLEMVADTVIPSGRGRGGRMGVLLVCAVPIFWGVMAHKMMRPTLGGSIEVFEEEEIKVGAWASGLLTAILIATAFALTDVRSLMRDGDEPFQKLTQIAPIFFWFALPWICQAVAVWGAVATHRWLETREA